MIAIPPDSPPPLPPSIGDPLVGFENDLGKNELPITPPVLRSTSVDLDPALDAVPSDPGATIVAEIDDTNAATSPNREAGAAAVIDDEFDDLTVHTPSSAIDQDVASAPSPVAIGNILDSAPADDTIVANLDVSLAEPASETAPPTPQPLDLGPSNVSPPDLDFAFDVSEQVPAGDISDSLGDSFSSLMDISESQILAGPPADPPHAPDGIATETVVDDSFAAGYDVSTSDLATAPPTHEAPAVSATEAAIDDSIAIGDRQTRLGGLQEDIRDVPHDDLREDLLQPKEPVASAAATTLPPEGDDLELGVPRPTSSGDDRIADLSPLVEQRIQETLEKVAWEAFSDLSESIVKQVIDQIEQIAWEVIPQMAETLVREEIRKLKGEKD
jgi:hypothetical protein